MGELFNHSAQTERRKKLRTYTTRAEYHLWHYLKNKQLGYKFRRQHGIDSFIVDFFCTEKQLAIELDGAPHFTPEGKKHDEERTKIIEASGIKVIRFTNSEVLNNTQAIIEMILKTLEALPTRQNYTYEKSTLD